MIAGVLFSLLASITLNSGNVIQKNAVGSMPPFSPRRSGHLIRSLMTSGEWMIGFALCLVGIALQIMAFALAPIPVVQSVFNAGIVLLLVLSRIRLGERLHRGEWIGIGIVILSLTAMSLSLTQSTGSIGVEGSGLRVLLATGPTLILAGIVVVAIRSGRSATGMLFGIAAGLLYGAAALGTKGASTLVVRQGLLHSIPHIIGSAYPYVFVVFSLFGMLIYQTGLQRARISVVGTMSDVICSTYVVAVGMVVFGEALPSNHTTLLLRLGGFGGVLLGSIFVALGGRKDSVSTMPPMESDISLGPILAAEIEATIGHAGGQIPSD